MLQKNWLSLNNLLFLRTGRRHLVFAALLLCNTLISQIGNHVTNGSFELKYTCNPPNYLNKAIGWNTIGADTTQTAGLLYSVNCFSNAPLMVGIGFQNPRSGNTLCRIQLFCTSPCSNFNSRVLPKNRLKKNPVANKTYCVKMYVSLEEASPYAISNLAFYFGDNTLDTIKYCRGPLTYLTPQVKNSGNSIISDTLNWVAVSGTFVATGNEKYLVIGNFDSDAATTKSLVIPSSTEVWSEYFVDDISCIEVNLPAFAGPDKSVIPGDSVYIGRELDFAIDSGCTWYKLPNITTPIKIASGLWVKPTTTSTYVVKQVLDCSPLKSDTVVVYMNPLGIVSSSAVENDLKLFPNPADDFLELSVSDKNLFRNYKIITIYNAFGSVLMKEGINFDNENLKLSTEKFNNGIYYIKLSGSDHHSLIKKFLVSR